MGNEQSIYFDINIYRRITRELSHYVQLEKFLDREEPGLLDNATVIFTWAQVLEACDLGRIISEIEQTQIWKQEIEGKKLIDRLGFQEGLGKYFIAAHKAVESLLPLQKDALLKSIDKAVSHTCPESRKLVENTLLRYREFVSANSHLEFLSRELAWAFLTSYPFVKSKKQWKARKICYDSLMALWHRLWLEGHDLIFFRMSEQQYHSYLLYSPDLDMDQAKISYPNVVTRLDLANEIFKFSPLKAGSDLCDGEITQFSHLNKDGIPVVGITMDGYRKTDQRMGILHRSLADLKRCVEGWKIDVCLGKILCLEVANNGSIGNATRILSTMPYNIDETSNV